MSAAWLAQYEELQARRLGRIHQLTSGAMGASAPTSPQQLQLQQLQQAAHLASSHAAGNALGALPSSGLSSPSPTGLLGGGFGSGGGGTPPLMSRRSTGELAVDYGGMVGMMSPQAPPQRSLLQQRVSGAFAGGGGGVGGMSRRNRNNSGGGLGTSAAFTPGALTAPPPAAPRRGVTWHPETVGEGPGGTPRAAIGGAGAGEAGGMVAQAWSPFLGAADLAAVAVAEPDRGTPERHLHHHPHSPSLQAFTSSGTAAPAPSPAAGGLLRGASGSMLRAAAPAAAYAEVAAERFSQNVDHVEARAFYNELEGLMASGCGLFDDTDADIIKVRAGYGCLMYQNVLFLKSYRMSTCICLGVSAMQGMRSPFSFMCAGDYPGALLLPDAQSDAAVEVLLQLPHCHEVREKPQRCDTCHAMPCNALPSPSAQFPNPASHAVVPAVA